MSPRPGYSVGTVGEIFRGDQRQAEATMAAHGVKPPRACNCVNPCTHTDSDGDVLCIYCGRAPRGLA